MIIINQLPLPNMAVRGLSRGVGVPSRSDAAEEDGVVTVADLA
jgi:hypothetical protein